MLFLVLALLLLLLILVLFELLVFVLFVCLFVVVSVACEFVWDRLVRWFVCLCDCYWLMLFRAGVVVLAVVVVVFVATVVCDCWYCCL